MSEKYKITSEELNQILASSPFALGMSPGERGMSGEQIRRYFFQFIRVFAQKLNIHLEDVEKGFEEASAQANSSIDSCKTELRGNLSEHNSSKSAHEDLRDAIRVAHNLAYGKTRVHPVQTWHHMCQLLLDEGVQEGDFIIIAEKGVPDFIVQEIDTQEREEDICFFSESMGVPIEIGNSYYFMDKGVRLLSLESGVDVNKLISRDEYSSAMSTLWSALTSHAIDKSTHEDIRMEIEGIRNAIDGAYTVAGSAFEKASSAYNLAFGKSKVYISRDFPDALKQLKENEGINDGDFIMVLNKFCPDFVVVSDEQKEDATDISYDMVQSGTLPLPEVGGAYRFTDTGRVIIGIESGIDTSAFATKEELGEVGNALDNIIAVQNSLIGGVS